MIFFKVRTEAETQSLRNMNLEKHIKGFMNKFSHFFNWAIILILGFSACVLLVKQGIYGIIKLAIFLCVLGSKSAIKNIVQNEDSACQ